MRTDLSHEERINRLPYIIDHAEEVAMMAGWEEGWDQAMESIIELMGAGAPIFSSILRRLRAALDRGMRRRLWLQQDREPGTPMQYLRPEDHVLQTRRKLEYLRDGLLILAKDRNEQGASVLREAAAICDTFVSMSDEAARKGRKICP